MHKYKMWGPIEIELITICMYDTTETNTN